MAPIVPVSLVLIIAAASLARHRLTRMALLSVLIGVVGFTFASKWSRWAPVSSDVRVAGIPAIRGYGFRITYNDSPQISASTGCPLGTVRL